MEYDSFNKVTKVYVTRPGGTCNLLEQHTHDALGRMTYDGLTGQSTAYNDLDLVRNISRNGTTLANYSYLADGTCKKNHLFTTYGTVEKCGCKGNIFVVFRNIS